MEELTREELIAGLKPGLHKVEEESIIGYKTIRCRNPKYDSKFKRWLLKTEEDYNKNSETKNFIAEVEIPVGSQILRPCPLYGAHPGERMERYVGSSIRTDEIRIRKFLEPNITNDGIYPCDSSFICYQTYNNDQPLKANDIIKANYFSTNMYEGGGFGLNISLDKNNM